jgi:hypothetical protein
VLGLCARFGWLPSAALDEDWATLAALQKRLLDEQAEAEHEAWQAKVRAGWSAH